MAVKKTGAATKLILKVQTGIGKSLGGLQSHTLKDVMRQDAAALTEA